MTKRKAKRRKRKRHGWFRRAVGRWAWGKVRTWARDAKAKVRKATAPKVIIPSAKQRAWESQFPSTGKPRPLTETIEKLDEWMALFEALFSNGWHVEFQMDSLDRTASVQAAAYDAAVLKHGEIARSLSLVEIAPQDDLADTMLKRGQ